MTIPITGTVDINGSVSGNRTDYNQQQFYTVTFTAGVTYTLTEAVVSSVDSKNPFDSPLIAVLNDANNVLGTYGTTTYGILKFSVEFTPSVGGLYYLSARDYNQTTDGFGAYKLSVTGTPNIIPLAVDGSEGGTVAVDGTPVVFAITLAVGEVYQFRVDSDTGSGGLANPAFSVRDASGDLVSFQPDNASTTLHQQETFVATTSGTYNVSVFGIAGGVGSFLVSDAVNTIDDSITKLYVGYYNRAPDPAGETYWAGRLQAGMSLKQIADSFAVQTESTNLYAYLANPIGASFNSAQAFVDAVYKNLLGRSADAAGEAYWTGQLINGVSTPGNAILNITGGAQGIDLLTVNNKVTVGDYYDTQVASNIKAYSLATAQAALVGVGPATSSVSNGESNIDVSWRALPHLTLLPPASQTAVSVVGISSGNDLSHIA